LDVPGRELVGVGDFDAFLGSIYEEGGVVQFCRFEDHYAGGDGGAEEEVVGELDDAVDVVVVNEILADFLFGSASVHHAGEADDGCRAVGCEPGEGVHDEGEVGFGFGGEDAGGGKSGVVDEGDVVVAFPTD